MERGNRSLIAALLVGVLLGVSSSGLAWLLSAREQFEPPTVGLTFDSEKFQVLVSRADDPPRPLLNFRADVSLNGTPYASLPRLDRPGDNILGFLDADMDGRLSVDDFFYLLVVRIEPHELVLSWKNIRVGSVSWQVIVPTVTFSPDHGQPQTMVITVSSASPVTPIADWSAAVSGNGYYRGSLDPLREETVQLSQGGSLTFEDANGDGGLSAGDRFTVVEGAYENYQLSLTWRRVLTAVASVSWWP